MLDARVAPRQHVTQITTALRAVHSGDAVLKREQRTEGRELLAGHRRYAAEHASAA
jgi:hypothetical protein